MAQMALKHSCPGPPKFWALSSWHQTNARCLDQQTSESVAQANLENEEWGMDECKVDMKSVESQV